MVAQMLFFSVLGTVLVGHTISSLISFWRNENRREKELIQVKESRTSLIDSL